MPATEGAQGLRRLAEEATLEQPEMEYTELRAMSPQEVIKAMFIALNGPGWALQHAMLEHLKREHPTLQQAFVRHLVRPALEYLADVAQYADARNRNACQYAKQAVEATRNTSLPMV